MDTGLLNSDNIYDAESGHFISRHHQYVAEVVAEYNPELRVVWIPTTERTVNSPKPYGVAHFPKDKEPYVIFFMTEAEMNHPTQVIEMLIKADQGRGSDNSVFSRLSAAEDARRLMDEKEELERRAEMHDKIKFLLRSPLHKIELGNGKVLHT